MGTATAKPWYRRVTVWLMVLILLYALIGFIGVPWYLKREIPARFEQHLGWDARMTEVSFNPFTFALDLGEFSAADADGEAVLSMDRLFVDLTLWQLTRGVIALDALAMEQPFVRLDVLEDGGLNLVNDWQDHNPSDDGQQSEGGGMPSLLLQRLSLAGGDVLLRDFAASEYEEFRVEPVDLELTDLTTFSREEASDYTLTAALGEQTLSWNGRLNLATLYSQGNIRLSDVSRPTLNYLLGRFASDTVPYRLTDGRISASSSYEFSASDGVRLITEDGVLDMQDVALALASEPENTLIRGGRLSVDQVAYSLRSNTLDMGVVTLDEAELDVRRDASGALNLWPQSDAEDPSAGSDSGREAGRPMQWRVTAVQLRDSRIRWEDQAVSPRAAFVLEQINVTARGLSQELDEPVDYTAELTLAEGGSLQAGGQLTPAPFTLENRMQADGVVLAPFVPYLRSQANLALQSGALTMAGDLDIDGQDDPTTGTFSGRGEISDLRMTLPDEDNTILSWQNLRLDPVEYNLYPARLELGTVTLTQPALVLTRRESGEHNVMELMVSDDSGTDSDSPGATPDSEQAESQASGAGQEQDFIFRLSELILEQGSIEYADRTLEPDFSTRIDAIEGGVYGLSNVSPQQGRMNLTGEVSEQGSIAASGSLGTLGTDATTDIEVTLNDLAVASLSPYFGRYLGYLVANGELELKLDYQLTGTQLEASNNVRLESFSLGDSVDSPEAPDIPVRLALALLRDRNGVIEVDLPISGDLGEPAFQLSGVIMTAFKNLLVRAATSPFSMLGAIVDMADFSEDELKEVLFTAGHVELTGEEQDKLKVLGEALRERPRLVLAFAGVVAPEADGQALQKRRLYEQLGIDSEAPQAERLARLEAEFSARQPATTLEQFRQEQLADQGQETLEDEAWERALAGQLGEAFAVSEEDLQQLATERGDWLLARLEESGASAEQLQRKEPRLDANADDQQVALPLDLDARE